MNNDPHRNYLPLLIVLTLGLYVFGKWQGDSVRQATPQVAAATPAPTLPVARVRKHEFDNGKAIAEYDLGRFRCFELLSEGEVRFACAAH